MTGRILAFLLLATLVLFHPFPAQAQDNPAEAMSPDEIRRIAEGMSEPEFRQFVLERLGPPASSPAPAPAETPLADAGNLVDAGMALLSRFGMRIVDAFSGGAVLAERMTTALDTFVARLGGDGVLWFAASIGIAVGAGLAAQFVVDRLASRWRGRAAQHVGDGSLSDTLRILGARLALDLVGLVAFLIVTRIVAQSLVPPGGHVVAHAFLLNCIVLPSVAAAVLRFVLAPSRPALRLVAVDDESAAFLFRNLVAVVIFGGIFIFLIAFMRENGGVPGRAGLGFWANLLVFAWIAWIAWKARPALGMMVRGGSAELTEMEERVARLYPHTVLFAIVGSWILFEFIVAAGQGAQLEGGKHVLTLAIVILSPALDTMIRGLVQHLVGPMRGAGAMAEKAYDSTKRSYIHIGRVLVFGAVILLVADIWDVNLIPRAGEEGARIAGRAFTFLIILTIGYLVWEVATLLFNRKLSRETTAKGMDPNAEDAGDNFGGAGASRLTTVLPLLRMGTQAAIVTLTILVALGNLGIDVTPLLAGAGIVGLAVGFGAQTLVKDIVSGIFFLVDDAFRVGEYVVIGSTVGTVEKISVRSLQLRHHEGPVHTIPYGSIGQVTNNSRDWVIVKMRFTVPFDTDINKIKKIFKKIGAEIMSEPYAGDLIQPFKSQGVASVDDVGIVVRGKFMAKPGKQWVIRKDIYSRIQREFAANGIEFARREVRVKIPGLDEADLSDRQKEAVAAGAAEAALRKS